MQAFLRITVAVLILGIILAAAAGGGYTAAHDVTVPHWLVGLAAGIGIFFAAGYAGFVLLLPAAIDAIESPSYRKLALEAWKEFGHWPLLPALALAMALSYWGFGTWASLCAGAGVYALALVGLYIYAWGYVHRTIGSATFAAGAYRDAGHPVQTFQS